MNKFNMLNYYEILEISVSSSAFEIRRAYKNALSVYSEDSLPSYSFFTKNERDKILKKIEDAFSTLIDEDKRAEYDRTLLGTGKIDASSVLKPGENKPIPIFQKDTLTDKDAIFKKIQKKYEEKDIKKISENIVSKDLISGNDLKELRESIGIKLEEVYDISRISITVLNSIENNQFEKLPSSVYLKNFLKSYAEILQIDPDRVAEGYLKHVAQIEK